jgi:hypothetical protein
MMKRLLYISTCRSPLSPSELDVLLEKARKENASREVTGLLVVGGRRFLQILEGPVSCVDATFERIARDPRHFALVKLHDKPVADRSFGAWAMGFERGGVAATSATLEEQVQAIVAPIADATLRAYFTGFAKTHMSV